MCQVLNVSRSGYYAWQRSQPSARQQEYDKLISIVKKAHKDSKGTYGARRMAIEIEKSGTPCGRTKAATVMALADVAAKQKKKFKAIGLEKGKPFNPTAGQKKILEEATLVGKPGRWATAS